MAYRPRAGFRQADTAVRSQLAANVILSGGSARILVTQLRKASFSSALRPAHLSKSLIKLLKMKKWEPWERKEL